MILASHTGITLQTWVPGGLEGSRRDGVPRSEHRQFVGQVGVPITLTMSGHTGTLTWWWSVAWRQPFVVRTGDTLAWTPPTAGHYELMVRAGADILSVGVKVTP